MQLSEILNDMRPAAEAAARLRMKLSEVQRALCLTYAVVVLEQNANNQKKAAEQMGVTQGYFSRIIHGRVKMLRVPKSAPMLQSNQSAAKVLGNIEL